MWLIPSCFVFYPRDGRWPAGDGGYLFGLEINDLSEYNILHGQETAVI